MPCFRAFLIVTAALMLPACQSVSTREMPSDNLPKIYPTNEVENILDLAGAEPTEFMILGSWHFATSNADLVNVDTASVLTSTKQAELQDIAASLCAFEPTAIVVEREGEAPDYVDPYFSDYGSEMLTKTENERVQLGYRIADTCGVKRVYAIDEQPSEGEPNYFPFEAIMAHGQETGQMDSLSALVGRMQEFGEIFAETIAPMPLKDALIYTNEGPASDPSLYYHLMRYDVGEAQPGAELLAYYTMRNSKIVSKMMNVTEAGDRVLVVYGAGHKHFLEQILHFTPKVEVVDPVPYLRANEK